MFGYKKAKVAKQAAAEAITTGREVAEVARQALELYQNARGSEEAMLGIIEGAAATGDVEHIQATVAQLRTEYDRYRAREDAADLVHRLGWTSL